MTRLSIVIPNYNHSCFLKERLSSILSQLSPDDELIVVDDASTDNSVELIETHFGSDPRLKLLKNAKNEGPIPTANKGAFAAQGDYIAFMAADDIILDGFIEKTMGALLAHPEMPLATSHFKAWVENEPFKFDEPLKPLIPGYTNVTPFTPSQIPELIFWSKFWIPGHTTILKRSLALKYGLFQEKFEHFCDWVLLHSIALFEGAIYVPSLIALFRVNPNSYSNSNFKSKQKQVKIAKVVLDHLNENRELKKRFLQAGLLRNVIRRGCGRLLIYPQYWDIIFSFLIRSRMKRIKTYLGKVPSYNQKKG